MTFPELRAGDVFATRNPQGLGAAINVAQKFWSADGESRLGHAGIIQNRYGLTLEARWTITEVDLFEQYAGAEVVIARPIEADFSRVMVALDRLRREHLGQWYPAWRLLLHLVPPLARKISAGGRFVVCSELVAKFLYKIGVRHKQYMGTNPDTLVDEWRHWKNYTIIFEGTLPAAGGAKA